MVDVKKILCPTDFSEFSAWALELALRLAKWYESEITVMHVVPRVLMHPEYFPYMQEPVLPSPDVRKQAQEELDRFTEKARKADIPTTARLEEGDSVEEILACASELPADLVVMGTHGRRGFERLVLGSVTVKVMRKGVCPLLTVSSEPRGLGASKEGIFKKILCPVDFSTPSVKALEYALSLAQEADGCLILLHVVESLFEGEGTTDLRSNLEREAFEKMKAAIPADATNWCQPEEIVLTGRPYQQILNLAGEREVDLIVMGIHGRSAVDLMLFGSTTNHVIRQAPCPVLTIRSG
jgi:nucleotide-binding universal stress UspA family protein